MDLIFPDWLGAPHNIGAFSTLRQGGVSLAPYDDGSGTGGGGLNFGMHVGDSLASVQQNRTLLKNLLPAEPAWLTQVHGTGVLDAANVKGAPEADASISTKSGVVCVIQTADCLPVLLCDEAGRVVAAAHAGWRGLVCGILEKTVAEMRNAGAGKIMAWLGPAIGPESFEVGEDVWNAFGVRGAATPDMFKVIAGKPGKYLANIYLLARKILGEAGVARIYGGDLCTVSDPRRFYSYRRDHVTGRMASLIWIK
jgi:polyphenol oxidase